MKSMVLRSQMGIRSWRQIVGGFTQPVFFYISSVRKCTRLVVKGTDEMDNFYKGLLNIISTFVSALIVARTSPSHTRSPFPSWVSRAVPLQLQAPALWSVYSLKNSHVVPNCFFIAYIVGPLDRG